MAKQKSETHAKMRSDVIEPTDEEIEAVLGAMRKGVGYERAIALAEIPRSRGARWLARGKEHMVGGHKERHSQFAKLARKVEKERAKVVARAEGVVVSALQSDDEDRALGTAKWILPRIAGRDYAERTLQLTERQKLAEQLVEGLRERISSAAFAEVLAALQDMDVDE